MVREDPRERYDDLIITREEETVSPEDFRSLQETDAGRSGWSVGALVFDSAGRILLVDNYWADGWIIPSGGVKPGESIEAAVVREVKEEGGVDAVPVRPHTITDGLTVNERSGESFETTFVIFEATAASPIIAETLGETGHEVSDARWFETLPRNVYNRDLTERVYRRCGEIADE